MLFGAVAPSLWVEVRCRMDRITEVRQFSTSQIASAAQELRSKEVRRSIPVGPRETRSDASLSIDRLKLGRFVAGIQNRRYTPRLLKGLDFGWIE